MDKQLLADIFQWDVLNWSTALEFWEKRLDWPRINSCLEVGGHDGGLSLWLASKGKHVLCSDLHDTESSARAYHQRVAPGLTIDYADIDVTRMDMEARFDLIAFKSLLGGVGRDDNKAAQQTAIGQMHRALKPGGVLLFAENLVGSALHRLSRRRFVRWGTSWRYVTQREMREFLLPFSQVQMRTTGVLGAFGRSEGQRRLLGHVDRVALSHLTPGAWHYIVYGIAEK